MADGSISFFSIYTLSDLGNSSNLIGSLSLTMTLYSPKTEQNHCCELGVLPRFHSKAFMKIHEYPSADDFEGQKRLHGV